MSPKLRRGVLDDLAELNQQKLADYGDPEIDTRITQYEMAYKMQTSVPALARYFSGTAARSRPLRTRRAAERFIRAKLSARTSICWNAARDSSN